MVKMGIIGRKVIVALLVLLFSVAARAAEPPSVDLLPSVAVLPLEKGAGSAAYDGLGRALAGMLVTDLSALPGLKLVEREQLEALLTEMKLKESGFLDPKTAQKLGKGVGARYVVVGSFTVIEPKFLLNARIVEVSSGEIVKSQDAAGTVEDFVSVEKDLVEKLVTNLDLSLSSAERRKLLASVATENFGAFSAYGEGLARQSEGKDDEAKAAFGRALANDPAFEDARRALDELSAMITQVQAERREAAAVVTDAARARLLADAPDERSRGAAYADTEADLILWDLRLNILREEHRACDVYTEMDHYLTRRSWKVAERAEPPLAVGMKLYDVMRKRSFLPADLDKMRPYILERFEDYLGTMGMAASDCYPATRALTLLDTLRKGVTTHGLDGLKGLNYPLGIRMDLLWADTVADRVGATDELTKRTAALLKADPSKEMEETVGRVLALAKATQRRRGVEGSEAARRVQAVADGKVAKTAVCGRTNPQRPAARAWLVDYGKYKEYRASPLLAGLLDEAIPLWAPASDFGCLDGVSPRFASAEAALTFFAKAHEREDTGGEDEEACAPLWTTFNLDVKAAKPANDLAALFQVDLDWSHLVANQCAHE